MHAVRRSAARLRRGKALVDEAHVEAVALFQHAGETARGAAHRLFAAVDAQRKPDYEERRSPFLDQRVETAPVRLLAVIHGRQRARSAQPIADRDADQTGTEIESQDAVRRT